MQGRSSAGLWTNKQKVKGCEFERTLIANKISIDTLQSPTGRGKGYRVSDALQCLVAINGAGRRRKLVHLMGPFLFVQIQAELPGLMTLGMYMTLACLTLRLYHMISPAAHHANQAATHKLSVAISNCMQ